MATVTLRQMIACAEFGAGFGSEMPGTLSVLHHFFMYTTVPKAKPGVVEEVSVARQIGLLRNGPHFNVNLISVGLDQLNDPSVVDRRVDHALALARRAFAKVGVGIGRAARGELLAAEAEGLDRLSGPGEADELRASFSFEKNDGIDVFLVRSYENDGVDKGGNSPVGGPCDQDGKGSGVVVTFQASDNLGMVLAHELGHYFGLSHLDAKDDPTETANIMFEGGKSNTASFAGFQGDTIRDHCMLRPPCA